MSKYGKKLWKASEKVKTYFFETFSLTKSFESQNEREHIILAAAVMKT